MVELKKLVREGQKGIFLCPFPPLKLIYWSDAPLLSNFFFCFKHNTQSDSMKFSVLASPRYCYTACYIEM